MGWLALWLIMLAVGPLAWLLLWLNQERIDDGYEALGFGIIVIAAFLVSAIGFLGTLGWLVVVGFG